MRAGVPDLPSVYDLIRRAVADVASETDSELLNFEQIERQVTDWVPEVGLLPIFLRVAIRQAAQEMHFSLSEDENAGRATM
jgi:hypothetical protein